MQGDTALAVTGSEAVEQGVTDKSMPTRRLALPPPSAAAGGGCSGCGAAGNAAKTSLLTCR